MNLETLIRDLSLRSAYTPPPTEVTVIQTHISVVFLAGDFAYKIKKPLNLGFLDFTTLERRKHFCEEEVRLNRRLAPSVYLGVVPITGSPGALRMNGDGEPVEFAVRMRRLDPARTFESLLNRGELNGELLQSFAQRIAQFHREAVIGEHDAQCARFVVVAGNCRENFDQTRSMIGQTVSAEVFEGLQSLTEAELTKHRDLIERRALRGVPRDTHGDLRLDHVYSFPSAPPPDDLVVVDCIEFNERFRYADPVADIAFFAMDLGFHGRADLARAFTDAYFSASGDEEGRVLLPLYTSYRALVRAKVEGFALNEKEIPEARRAELLRSAKAHFLLAYKRLQPSYDRPCLILIGGLPATGKSRLAEEFAHRGVARVSTDLVRKELAGLRSDQSAVAAFGEGIYSPEWIERTYDACLTRVRDLLFRGKRVVVDANFGKEAWRRKFLDAAAEFSLPAVLFICESDPEQIKARLGQRKGDASDADWEIYKKAAARWEPLSPLTERATHRISTHRTPQDTFLRAMEFLNELGLA